MKEIEIEEPIIKEIEVGKKTISKYKAEDGTIFDTENVANNYEEKCKINKKISKIKQNKVDWDLLEFDRHLWYYASNEEELKLICENILNIRETLFRSVSIFGELKVGEWIAKEHCDGGDGRDSMYMFIPCLM